MVALLGLLQKHEILVEHLLLGECYAVDAHKLVALFVAAPVSTGKRGYLHCLDGGGVGEVRTAAQVGERTLGVGGYVTVLKLADQLALVLLVALAKHFHRIGFCYVGSDNGLFLLGEFSHLGLDLGEVGGGYGVTVGVDVVVESVFNGRAYAELHARVELLESFGEKVGRTVPESVLAFRVIPLEEFYFGVVIDGAAYVPFFAVDGGRKNVLGQARAYAFGNLQRSRAGFVLP